MLCKPKKLNGDERFPNLLLSGVIRGVGGEHFWKLLVVLDKSAHGPSMICIIVL